MAWRASYVNQTDKRSTIKMTYLAMITRMSLLITKPSESEGKSDNIHNLEFFKCSMFIIRFKCSKYVNASA